MILRSFYIREDQDKQLRELKGNDSENVRIALDKHFKDQLKVSESLSYDKSNTK